VSLRVRAEVRPQRSAPVQLSFDPSRVHLFDAVTGKRLATPTAT